MEIRFSLTGAELEGITRLIVIFSPIILRAVIGLTPPETWIVFEIAEFQLTIEHYAFGRCTSRKCQEQMKLGSYYDGWNVILVI